MNCETCALYTLSKYKYVVIFSRFHDKWLLSKHKMRNTWETQGGHIEKGETPEEAAKRELFEESGATEFSIDALCDYWASDENSKSNGVVFFAEIKKLDHLPDSEMEKVELFEKLPNNLTYPDITPTLFRYLQEKMRTAKDCMLPHREYPSDRSPVQSLVTIPARKQDQSIPFSPLR